MEEKKLKEIEAKLSQLLRESKKSQENEAISASAPRRSVEVIRRRKGHSDLHIS